MDLRVLLEGWQRFVYALEAPHGFDVFEPQADSVPAPEDPVLRKSWEMEKELDSMGDLDPLIKDFVIHEFTTDSKRKKWIKEDPQRRIPISKDSIYVRIRMENNTVFHG